MSWTSKQQREVPRGRSNKWTVNERRGRKEEDGQMEAQQSYNDLQWTNLNTKEACWGQKDFRSYKRSCMFAVNPFLTLEIHSQRDIALKGDLLFQHHALTSTTLWSADKLSKGEARWTDLLTNSISIELSAVHWGRQPHSSGPLAALPDFWFTLH